jgi:hypothetical protein
MRTCLILLSCLLILAGSGCHRKRQGTLSGRLLEDCSGTPAINKTINFHTTRTGGGIGARVAQATTDSNGYFSVSYEYRRHRSLVMYAGGGKMHGVPVGTTVLGNIYLERETRCIVKVKVNNAYALSNDELKIRFDYPELYSMHTPFHDTVFPAYVFSDIELPYRWNVPESRTSTMSWSYVNNLLPSGSASIDVNYCNDVPDTIYLTIN